ncbi:hypothetical protein H8D85_02375 [bacterium]|nr:hypothetical protein [bacterium]
MSIQIAEVFKLYTENGTKLCVELPEELVQQIDVHADDKVTVEYTESWEEDGEYHEIILSFRDKNKLNK